MALYRLTTAACVARSAHQRTMVANYRVRALRALKRMAGSMPPLNEDQFQADHRQHDDQQNTQETLRNETT